VSWAAAIVIIVAIWGLVSIMRSRHNSTLGYGTDEKGNPVVQPQRERELQAEIAQLRERLEVLERIATDTNSDEWRESKRLSAEINSLRGQD